MHWTIGADTTSLTRLFFQFGGGAPTSTNLNTIAASFVTAAGTNLKPLQPAGILLQSIFLQDISSATGAAGSNAAGYAGTRAGSLLPGGNALLANYAIGRRYRGGKPRSYWPMGVSTDLVNASLWSPTFVTAAQAGINAFFAACLAATGGSTTISAHVNVSYYQGFTNVAYGSPPRYRQVPTLRPGGPVVDVIGTTVVSAIPGTQRRRYGR